MKLTTYINGDIDPNNVRVEITNDDGSVVPKSVSLGNYVAMLNRCVGNAPDEVLAKFDIPAGMAWLGFSKPSTFKALVYVPAGQQLVKYLSEECKFIVPFPALLFYIAVKEGVLQETKVFATKEDTAEKAVRSTSELWCFPFGNGYSDGKICWGVNALPSISCPAEVLKIMSLFFSATMNTDLFHFSKGSDPTGYGNVLMPEDKELKSLGEFLTFLSGKDTFDNQLLVKNYCRLDLLKK